MRGPWSTEIRGLVAAAVLAAGAGLVPVPVSYARQAPEVGGEAALLEGLRWRNIGPNRGGRSIAVAGSVARPAEYYFGATGGGLWKTTDGGENWRPVTDGQIKSSSVGAVAVCEANPDVVYIGMGEVALRGNIMQGDGVYRSTDGGKSWQHLGLAETQAIARVRIHPKNCDEVYVAALGHPYGPATGPSRREHAERGVYKTTDGGKSWRKILYRGERAGAVDLAMDPSDPQVLYAAFWEVFRTPWMLSSGGPGSGLFKSTDGGRSWTDLTNNPGMPKGLKGKIGVSVSGADPNRVYAIVEADEGGLFVSDDAGRTWTRVNEDRNLRQRAFYYTRVQADPQDRETVYILNVGFHKSTDGGKTTKTIRVPHGDNHDLWIDPTNPKRMVQSNDGGANVSTDGGQSWTAQDFPTAQLYHVVTTKHLPYQVCGAQQDNSTICVPSNGNGSSWTVVGGGESGYVAPDPKNLDVFYSGNYGGNLSRFHRFTGQTRNVQIWPENPMGHSSEDIRERFQWTFPIVFSPVDPGVLYASSQHLWKSTNGGQSWERISPNLTVSDPKTMGPSGGPITRDQTGVETYATIFTVAPSRHDVAIIWAGSDDGVIHVTRDGGKSWQNITPPDLPKQTRISLIEASPHAPGTAYVAAKRYQMDDRSPYIYRTHDFGKSWTKIVAGIPGNDYVHAVREDPKRKGLLYAGTEHGVYVSWDDGARWRSLSLNLPDVAVHDLVVEESDLVIATHGRAFYVLDQIGPIRQMAPQVAAARAHLFQPEPAIRSVQQGVSVQYLLAAPAQKATLEFLDTRGNVIRSFTAERTEAKAAEGGAAAGEDDDERPRSGATPRPSLDKGLQRFVWDLRHPGFTDFPGMILWAARSSGGPRVVPGTYQVRLTVDGETQTRPFEVRKDPRLTDVTQADLEAQFELAMKIRDRTSEANEAVILIRSIREQVDARIQQAGNSRLTRAGEALKSKLGAVEEEIYQVRNRSGQDPLNFPIKLNNKIAALLGIVEAGDGRPTAQSYQVFDELSARLDVQLGRLRAVLDKDLAEFNNLLRSRKLDPVQATRPERPVAE